MQAPLTLIRVDPTKRTVVALRKSIGSNPAGVQRVIQNLIFPARNADTFPTIDARILLQIELPHDVGIFQRPVPLVVSGRAVTGEDEQAWRIKGCENTTGIGLLFGQGPNGGMVDCPVSKAWVEERIVWVDGEDEDQIVERARLLLPSIDIPMQVALLAAEDAGPFHDADTTMLLPVAAAPLYHLAMEKGLTDEVSGGRCLTKVGAAVAELLRADSAL